MLGFVKSHPVERFLPRAKPWRGRQSTELCREQDCGVPVVALGALQLLYFISYTSQYNFAFCFSLWSCFLVLVSESALTHSQENPSGVWPLQFLMKDLLYQGSALSCDRELVTNWNLSHHWGFHYSPILFFFPSEHFQNFCVIIIYFVSSRGQGSCTMEAKTYKLYFIKIPKVSRLSKNYFGSYCRNLDEKRQGAKERLWWWE